MREIKFRAWDKKTNSMFSAEVMESANTLCWGEMIKNHNKEQVILMQSTNLKDKNEVEIYEGDIIKYGYADFEEDKTIHQVVWCGEDDYPAFDLKPYLDIENNGLSHAIVEGEIEAIGNIYEHPKLLEEKNGGQKT